MTRLTVDRLPRCPWCGHDVTNAKQHVSQRTVEILGVQVRNRTTITVTLTPCGHQLTGTDASLWTSAALTTAERTTP